MSGLRGQVWRDFGLSALLGSSAGAIIATATIFSLGATHEWVGAILLVLILTVCSFPFVALGLGVFGLPATILLGRNAPKWWAGAFAVALGAIAGKLLFTGMGKLLKFNGWFLGISEPGIVFGITTALIWWLMTRRRLLVRG